MKAFLHLCGILILTACVTTSTSNTRSPNAALEDGVTRSALVIGNGAYSNIADLDNPSRDARVIASSLQQAGYDLHGGGPQIDLTRHQMRATLAKFSQAVSLKGGIAFIYYAGHGVQLGGVNYLLPTDARINHTGNVREQSVDLQEMLSMLGSDKIDMKLVVLDACRNNPFTNVSDGETRGEVRTGAADSSVRSLRPGLSQLVAPPGSLVAFAAAPGDVAYDGEPGQNRPSAAALAEAMKRPGLRIEDVFIAVRNIVRARTQGAQTPWETSSLTSVGSFSGAAGQLGQQTGILSSADLTSNWDGRYEALERCGRTGNSPGFEHSYWVDIIGGRGYLSRPKRHNLEMEFSVADDGALRVTGSYFAGTHKQISMSGQMSRGVTRFSGDRGPRRCNMTMRYVSSIDAPRPTRPAGLPASARPLTPAELSAKAAEHTWVGEDLSSALFLDGDGTGVFVVKSHLGEEDRENRNWIIQDGEYCYQVQAGPQRCSTIFTDGDLYYLVRSDNTLGWRFHIRPGNQLVNVSPS